MKRSYFILEPLGKAKKHKQAIFWTQDAEEFINYVVQNIVDASGNMSKRFQLFWKNKPIKVERVITKYSNLCEGV